MSGTGFLSAMLDYIADPAGRDGCDPRSAPDGTMLESRFPAFNDVLGCGILPTSEDDVLASPRGQMREEGASRYRGGFEANLFHGEGVLEWSSRARYAGEFRAGQYHGAGTFEWPDRIAAYHGQWAEGEMHGRGVLSAAAAVGAAGEPPGDREPGERFVYVGEFSRGHMEGLGRVTFVSAGERVDRYKGSFSASVLRGPGTFTWAEGDTLSGMFEDGYCNSVGRKAYADGRVYQGELREDLEHGRGVLLAGGARVAGIWRAGECVEELREAFVPALDPDAAEGEESRGSPGNRNWSGAEVFSFRVWR
ncbi:unnamed protein product [Prorocentrum cordatum]|uniref:MORN repeat-containing protein 5 n=1 Tax=Prorocentrum cordatum TaxID=2364126 RepID=A0ABN9XM41_9DINO|nr:unnamed protein product [Polarella glacialis]